MPLEEIANILHRKPPTIRKHLEILEKQKIIAKRKSGKNTLYFIPNETTKTTITKWGIEKLKEHGITEI